MADEDAHFRLRLPVELRDKLVEIAERNQRSINAEVVARLQESLAKGDEFAEMKKTLEAMQKSLDEACRHIDLLECSVSEVTRHLYGEDNRFYAEWKD